MLIQSKHCEQSDSFIESSQSLSWPRLDRFIKKSYIWDPTVKQAIRPLASMNPFRFSSEYHDDELGLVYYNYRHYNALDDRLINRDPIEEDGGWNLYGMVGNNTLNKNDYLGKKTYGCTKTSSRPIIDKKTGKVIIVETILRREDPLGTINYCLYKVHKFLCYYYEVLTAPGISFEKGPIKEIQEYTEWCWE